jgi:AcrR family transcriptional regulator
MTAARASRLDNRPSSGGVARLARVTNDRTGSRGGKKKPPGSAPVVRRRRPKEETRELLLQEAEDLLVERLAQGSDTLNPLAALRITDVLRSINERHSDESRMTTGAAYQIWESQTDFQDELYDRIMRKVSVPWEARVRESMNAAMAAGLPLEDVLCALGDAPTPAREKVELTLAAGLSAFVSPARIRRAEKRANAEFVRVLGGMIEEALEYGGRRMRPGLTIPDIVWLIEAVGVGTNLRERSHPELVRRADSEGRQIVDLALVGIVMVMTEAIPGRRSPRRRRSS